MKEAKSNEIRKDSIDRMISQMKKRMEENDKMEKEIQERKKDCFRKKNVLDPIPYFTEMITRYTSMHIDCINDRSN